MSVPTNNIFSSEAFDVVSMMNAINNMGFVSDALGNVFNWEADTSLIVVSLDSSAWERMQALVPALNYTPPGRRRHPLGNPLPSLG
jgi:hypothetical protein